VFLTQPDEDDNDIGLKGTKHYLIRHVMQSKFILGCISGPTVGSKKSWKRKSQREAGDDDFEDKENTG